MSLISTNMNGNLNKQYASILYDYTTSLPFHGTLI